MHPSSAASTIARACTRRRREVLRGQITQKSPGRPRMFGYYFDLTLRSMRRSRALTALMILAIGLGIGASMTMLTVLHVMSGDPLPERSGQLFYPHLDPRPLSSLDDSGRPDPSANLTWVDADNLLQAHRAQRQAAMAGGSALIRPANGTIRPFFQDGHFVSTDFFAMFGASFRAGSGWTRDDDARHARVLVLNGEMANKLFGDAKHALGQTVRLKDTDFSVIGVLDDWRPQPLFYADVTGHAFGKADQFFAPLTTALELGMDFNGNLSCWGNGGDAHHSDQCSWLQFWVELRTAADVRAYRDFLADYWREQQGHGRFPRPVDPGLYDLMGWLAHMHLVPSDVRLQLWLALGFLGVCMLNIVGLLLAKFLRRNGEISVSRALGARRRDIFAQFGMESAVIGLVGGVLGLLLAQLGLWSVRQRPDDYARLAHMDPGMLFATFALAVLASVMAGLLPAWRACDIPPALQLKTQ
jgi:putative ABC transport system permease protein